MRKLIFMILCKWLFGFFYLENKSICITSWLWVLIITTSVALLLKYKYNSTETCYQHHYKQKQNDPVSRMKLILIFCTDRQWQNKQRQMKDFLLQVYLIPLKTHVWLLTCINCCHILDINVLFWCQAYSGECNQNTLWKWGRCWRGSE